MGPLNVRFRGFPGVSPTITASPAGTERASHALEDPGFLLVAAGGFGVHEEVEAQAVVVQASHELVAIGVGNYSRPEVPGPAATRPAPLGDYRRRVHLFRVRVGELSGAVSSPIGVPVMSD
jgi:hypothetical protein